MAVNTARHVAAMLRRAPDARPVVFGTQSTWGVLNDDDQMARDETGQAVPMRERHVTIAAGALTGVSDDSTLTVGGVEYSVRSRPMPRENGELWVILLGRVSS